MSPVLYRLAVAACVLVGAGTARFATAEEPSSNASIDLSALVAEPNSELEDLRGGDQVTEINALSSTESTSTVTGNEVTGEVSTGSIGLGPEAISNLHGIFVSTFNTGNNTSIQTNLTVQVRLDQ